MAINLSLSAPRILMAALAAVMLLAGGLLLMSTDAGEKAGKYTFITADHPPNYPFLHPVRQGEVDMPENVRLETVSSPSAISEQLVAGNADIGYTSFVALPEILQEHPDARIVSYKGNAPHRKSGLYARKEANITSIEDLRGAKVGIPMRSSSGILTLMALDEEGIDYEEDMEVVPTKGSAGPLVASGDVDAGLYFGMPSERQMDELEPVFYPTGYMEENFGSDVLVLGVTIRGEEDAIRAGNRTFEAFREAGRYSIQNTGKVSDRLRQETGQNFSRTLQMVTRNVSQEESLHVPMSETDFEVLQRALDFAYKEELVPHRIDVENLRS